MFGTLKVFCKQKALSKSVRRFVCKLCLSCKVSAVTVFFNTVVQILSNLFFSYYFAGIFVAFVKH